MSIKSCRESKDHFEVFDGVEKILSRPWNVKKLTEEILLTFAQALILCDTAPLRPRVAHLQATLYVSVLRP
jgi:hypothetical protein